MIRNDENWLSVTDAFYSAAIDGQGWHGALEGLAMGTGSRAGELIGLGAVNAVSFNYVTGLGQDWADEFIAIGGGDPGVNPYVRAGIKIPVLNVLSSAEFVTREERRRSMFMADHARRHDIPHICLTNLIKENGMLVGMAVIRSRSQGEISAKQRAVFSTIAPHVRAAVRMQMALEQQGAALMTNAMEALSLAAFVCDRLGSVKAMTPAAESLVSAGDTLTLKNGQLSVAHPPERHALDEALLAATEGLLKVCAPVSGTVLIRGNRAAPLALEVLRLPRREYSFGFEPRALVIARAGSPDPARMKKLLRMAYELTDAEAEVAMSLADGKSPEMIAVARGKSIGTVRTQIRFIYAKLEVNRQSELVSKLNQMR